MFYYYFQFNLNTYFFLILAKSHWLTNFKSITRSLLKIETIHWIIKSHRQEYTRHKSWKKSWTTLWHCAFSRKISNVLSNFSGKIFENLMPIVSSHLPINTTTGDKCFSTSIIFRVKLANYCGLASFQVSHVHPRQVIRLDHFPRTCSVFRFSCGQSCRKPLIRNSV